MLNSAEFLVMDLFLLMMAHSDTQKITFLVYSYF